MQVMQSLLYVYSVPGHMVNGSGSYVANIMHIYLQYIRIKQFAQVVYVYHLTNILVYDTYMAAVCEVNVAVDYGLCICNTVGSMYEA